MSDGPRTSAMVTVSVFGLNSRLAMLNKVAPSAVKRGMAAGVLAATIEVQGQVKHLLEGTVLNRRSARLWRSITADAFDKTGTTVGVVGTNVRYAAIHEFGGVIRPKKPGGFLVWKGGDGGAIFAREVNMPRRPYMSRAFSEKKQAVRDIVMRNVMQTVRREIDGSGPAGGGVLPASARRGVGFGAN